MRILSMLLFAALLLPALTGVATAQKKKFPKVVEGGEADPKVMAEFEAYARDLMQNTLAKRGERWLCKPVTSNICGEEGCQRGKDSEVKIYINFQRPLLSRCDHKGCDHYEDPPVVSGMYTFFANKGGYFLKILNDGTEYMEVSSIWLNAFIKYGTCEPYTP